MDCLAECMEKCESRPGRLEVDTGNTVQKISLQKYIATECGCEVGTGNYWRAFLMIIIYSNNLLFSQVVSPNSTR